MATYRYWSVSLWRDPDDVSHCRILSPDKTEWWLISATLCRWKRCFVADQLWFMTRIREEEEDQRILGLFPNLDMLTDTVSDLLKDECLQQTMWCNPFLLDTAVHTAQKRTFWGFFGWKLRFLIECNNNLSCCRETAWCYVTQGHWKWHPRVVHVYGKFVLVFHCNCVFVSYRFWDRPTLRQVMAWSWVNLENGC